MLIEHVNELIDFGIVKKDKSIGYPLKTSLSLTERGQRLLEAIVIMQELGVEIRKDIQ